MFLNLGTIGDIIKGAGNFISNVTSVIDDINCTSLPEDDKNYKVEEKDYVTESSMSSEISKYDNSKEIIYITKEDFVINKFFMDRTRPIRRDENGNRIN